MSLGRSWPRRLHRVVGRPWTTRLRAKESDNFGEEDVDVVCEVDLCPGGKYFSCPYLDVEVTVGDLAARLVEVSH